MHLKTEILYINPSEKQNENYEEQKKSLILSVALTLHVTLHKVRKRSPIRRECPRGNEPLPISITDLDCQR